MEIVKEKIDEVTALLKVNVQPEDYREGVTNALKEYAKKANLPGFRPGKVPLSVIKNMVGKAIVLDELNKTLYSRVNDWIKENDIEIIGEPLPKPMDDIDLDPDGNTAYDFLYEIGLVPEFQLNLKIKDFPKELAVVVDDEFLNKEIANMQKRQGKMENPEVAEAGDMLFGFLGESEKENYVAGRRLRKAYVINPDRGSLSATLLSQIPGRKEGDMLTVKMTDLFGNPGDVRDLWEEHPENGEHFHLSPDAFNAVMEMDFMFEVKKVNRMVPVEISQEFFDKVLGPGRVTTEEDFRQAVREDIDRYLNREAGNFFRGKVMQALIDGNPFSLSTEFLRKWLKASRENVNEHNVDEMMPSYQRDLKWSLIVNEILKQHPELKVTAEDIREKTRKMITSEYGMGEDNERLDGLVDRFLEQEDYYRRTTMQVLDDKIFDFIRLEVQPGSEEITATAFLQLS